MYFSHTFDKKSSVHLRHIYPELISWQNRMIVLPVIGVVGVVDTVDVVGVYNLNINNYTDYIDNNNNIDNTENRWNYLYIWQMYS